MIGKPEPSAGTDMEGAAPVARGARPSALGGVRVVEFGHGAAGAQAGMVLADFGADVVAVRPPARVARAPLGPAALQWDRGKDCRTCDLDDPGEHAWVTDLVAAADVVIDALAEGCLERFDLGHASLRARHPNLVVATLRGSDPVPGAPPLPGRDAAVLAATGRMLDMGHVLGWDRPAYIPVPILSFAAAQAVVQGVLAALHARRRTGHGDLVRASLARSVVPYDVGGWLAVQFPGVAAAAAQVAARGSRTPYMGYLTARAADGRWLQFADWAPHLFWAQLDALGLGELRDRPEFAQLPFEADDAVFETVWDLVLEAVQGRPALDWVEAALEGRRFGVDVFRGGGDGMDHPQVRHNCDVVEVAEPASLQLAPIADLHATPGGVPGAASANVSPRTGAGSPGLPAAPPSARRSGPTVGGGRGVRPGALGNITVVEFATMLAGPYGPSLLAEQGARVIKVEPCGGDPMRQNPMFGVKTQQGKESVALDLKAPQARPVVEALVARADVVVENFRPGVAERLGLSYGALSRRNPGLIYVHASGYGTDGPYAGLPAYHPTPGAVCGNALLQAGEGFPGDGAEEDPHGRRAVSYRLAYANEGHPDSVSAVVVATAALLALAARDATGFGQEVTTTMLRSNGYLMGAEWIRTPEGHGALARPDAGLHGVGPLRRLYRCADGGWVLLECVTPRERAALWSALGDVAREGGAGEPGPEPDGEAASELSANLEARFATRPADEWVLALSAAGAPCVRADLGTSPERLRDDPALRQQEIVADTCHPLLGPHFRQGALVRLDTQPQVLGAGTRVGEHTRQVLAELGFDAAEVERLRSLRVVSWPQG